MLKYLTGWLAVTLAASALPTVTQAQSPAHTTPIRVAAQMAYYTAPHLSAQSVLVLNGATDEPLYEKRINQRQPIASITKLMTAMVLLDSDVSLDESIFVTDAEIDRLKHTRSRLNVGTELSRREMLLLALMSSENRAAAALARTTTPGGTRAFIALMNEKARQLGMNDTVFYDPTGLDMRNTSTARDLARLVKAAQAYPLIREFTTTAQHEIYGSTNRLLHYRNSNALIREGLWDIGLQKTGYINEAGHCMVMETTVGAQPLIIVILSAGGGQSRVNDARALRSWLESHPQNWLTAS